MSTTTSDIAAGELVWQPIKTAPFREVVWVRNPVMDEPILATRGYVTERGVHPDDTFFTTAYTPHQYFPTPAGRLCCPTEWAKRTAPSQIKEG